MTLPDRDSMVKRGAHALYDRWLRTSSYFRSYDEVAEHFEEDARLVLEAALDEQGES